MHYKMKTPCTACPFLKNSGFTYPALMLHASAEFPCHKACDKDDETGTFNERGDQTPHCAGALIFLEKQGRPHQMMRVCERLGLYDHRGLAMGANVGSKPSDYRAFSADDRVGQRWLDLKGFTPEDLPDIEDDIAERESQMAGPQESTHEQ